MNKFLAATFLLLSAPAARSQQISQVSFSNSTTLSYFSILTDQDILIRISPEGKLLEWGTELLSNRSNYFDPKLQPYLGRVDYYGSESDSAFTGKVRSIGTCVINYYGHYEEDTKRGKLRSIGNLTLDYYSDFDDPGSRGKLRFIGSSELTYYSSHDDEMYRGKLKSISNTPITYYSTFDDKLIRGRLKSIGSVNLDWYTSFDRSDLAGSLKSGLYRQVIGSITYILR